MIVAQLCKRYQKKMIYTNVGDILVSINPFQNLDIYDEEVSVCVYKIAFITIQWETLARFLIWQSQ